MISFRIGVTLVAATAVAAVAATLARAEKPPSCETPRCEALAVAATIPLERSPSCGTSSWRGHWTITAPGINTTTLTVRNTGHFGTGKLETTYGTGAGFIYTDDTCTGANLAPGKSCSITVTLAATAVTSYVDGGLIVRGRIHKGWNPLARIVLAGRPA